MPSSDAGSQVWSCGGRRWSTGGSWSRRCARPTGRRSSRSPTGRGRGRSRSICSGADRNVAFVHSDVSDAQRTEAWRRAARGKCVVVGGRIGRARAGARSRGRDRRRRRRRGAAGRAVAHVARARRAARAGARAPGASWSVVSPAPTVEALALAGRASSTRRRPTSRRAAGRASLVVDRREEPPGAGLLTEAFAAARARRGRPGGVRAQPARPLPRARVRRVPRAAALGSRSTERPMVCDECGATRLRVLRAGVTRVREELAALFPRLRVLDVDAATTEVGDGRHPDRHRGRAAPARDAPPPPDARRVPRSRPGAARAALPRRRAGALAHDARRAAARRSSPRTRRACSCRPANPITRWCARS